MQTDLGTMRYAGFGERCLASLIDSLIQLPLLGPVLWLLLRADIAAAAGDPFVLAQQMLETLATPLGRFIVYGLPLFYSLVFWKFKSATPGKLLMDMKIVDATTGAAPTFGRLLLRCIGYVINAVILFLGFLWIAVDRRKQGLHDKLANTVVVMMPRQKPAQA